MKILSVSDQVDQVFYRNPEEERFTGLDLILSCGDLAPEYLTFLTHTFKAPLLFVRGNHDLRYESKPPAGCLDIHARVVRFRGLNILGLEGSRWYNGGPHQYTENQMRFTLWRTVPHIWWRRGLDLVITHAPPRFIHDAEDPCHRGFKVFRRLIDKYQPRYFIHGHIHADFTDPEQRQTLVGRTKVINTYGHYLFETEDDRMAE
ncbi:MAG: metallophosphoesterase [Thermodesulfobacteriota bacterium]